MIPFQLVAMAANLPTVRSLFVLRLKELSVPNFDFDVRVGIFVLNGSRGSCRSDAFRGFREDKNRTDHHDQGKRGQHQESGPENHRNQMLFLVQLAERYL
jgi:hypothetical protein